MTKETEKSTVETTKPFASYYQVIAKACGCSRVYAKMVLENKLGKYHERNSDLIKKIRAKAQEINSILDSQE